MKIKITTTEKKLTQAIIKQMFYPSLNEMKNGTVLGFVHAGKLHGVIIEYKLEYSFLPLRNWQHGVADKNILYYDWNGFPRWKEFKTEEDAAEWLAAYRLCKEEALKTQVYL